jgi:hypothetical protein
MKRREAAYPVIHYNYTPCRKDWLFVGKEDSMGARRSSVMIRDGTTEEKERQHDD